MDAFVDQIELSGDRVAGFEEDWQISLCQDCGMCC